MSEFDILQIGSLIRKVRKESGLRLEDIADENISPATVSNIERGVPHVSMDKVMYLLEKLGLTMDDIPQILESEENELDRLKLRLLSIESMLDYADPNELLSLLNDLQLSDDHKYAAHVHYLRGKCYTKKPDWKKAEKCFLNAIRLSATNSYGRKDNIEARSFNDLGICYYFQNDLIQALQYTENAADAFNEDGEFKQLKHVINCNRARYLEKLGRFGEAMKVVNESWRYLHEMDNHTALHFYDIRVILLKRSKMYDEAIQYAKEGIELARLNSDNISLFYLWKSLGSTYLSMNELYNAEICFKSALTIGCPQSKNSLVEAYTKLSIVYIKQKNWIKAKELLDKAELLAKAANVVPAFFVYLVSGDFYKEQSNSVKAIELYEKALDLARKYNQKRLEHKVLFRLAQLKKNENKEEFAAYLENMYEVAVTLEKEMSDGGDYGDIL
ncbi:tetratricopeptide repeat protein [Polycladomyces subterraneus]|uniref:Tetratricopeptide repeat protein n=1 Tax=Polycladomyces subterraneus TaxID=1016997 RepID=A0ABT8IJ36_9BACL|nr:tetratricopeptide repeat protein [Polycladomyces subterraneus]MDN4592397.1 tetratricopeptide repeat protein [Polycladomyces subterraneus]